MTLADPQPTVPAATSPDITTPAGWLEALRALQIGVSTSLYDEQIARAGEISDLLWALIKGKHFYHEAVSSREFPHCRTVMVIVRTEKAANRLTQALRALRSPLILDVRPKRIGEGQRHEVAFDLAPRPAGPTPADSA
jgi:hypothetical protein